MIRQKQTRTTTMRKLTSVELAKVSGGYIMENIYLPPMEQRLEQVYDRTFFSGGSTYGSSRVRH